MKKVNISIAFDDERLDALEFSLKKENSSVQARMDEALKTLYEDTVPEPVREYLDSKIVPVVSKPRRPAKSGTPKPQAALAKPSFSAVAAVTEGEKNG